MKSIFNKVAKSSPDIHAIAVADDFYIVTPPSSIVKAYNLFNTLCSADGSIQLNPDKKFFFYFHSKFLNKTIISSLSSLGFKIVTTVTKVLGAPVGICDQAVE